MAQAAVHIPAIYWIQFSWVDPIICSWTAYTDLFDPNLVLTALIPDAKRNPEHDTVFHQNAGLYLLIAFLAITLPRSTKDIKVLKLFQASIAIVDFILLWSIWVTLDGQGRLSPSVWRPEDWASVVVTVWAALLRTLFVSGVGLSTASKRVKSV